MYTNALFAALFISYGVFLDTGVSGRSPPGPTSASTTINPASGSSTSSPSSSAAQESSLCPAVADLPFELCMQQTRQDARSCSSDADCFLPGYVCCRHFCGTRVCKRINGDSAARDVNETRNDPQAKGKSAPTNIKHRQNVLAIDELAADYLKGKAKPPAERIKSTQLPKPHKTKAEKVTDHNIGSSTIKDSPSTKSSLCPAVVDIPLELCMQQTRQDARSCSSDADCFLPGYVCCRHFCGTRVCKRINGDSAARDVDETRNDPQAPEKSVPKNIKHRQNVLTIDELAANYLKGKAKPPAEGIKFIPLPKPLKTKAAKVTDHKKGSSTIKDSPSTKSSLCPAIADLPFELCMQQNRQDARSCRSDTDCFLPGYICCRHYCGTRVCKRISGDSATRDVDETRNYPKLQGKSVPTNIKHRQNVPTIDEIAANYLKDKTKPPAEEIKSITVPKPLRSKAANVTVKTIGSSTIKDSSTPTKSKESSLCPPVVVDLPMELCMQQTLQDAMSCNSDDDCFLPGHICCPHYCGTYVCKRINGDSAARDVDGTENDPKAGGKGVPTNIKHRQNIPTIDGLGANFLKSKAKPPAEEIRSTQLSKESRAQKTPFSGQQHGSPTIKDSSASTKSNGDSATRDKEKTRNEQKTGGEGLRTKNKNRLNLPTFDELTGNILKGKTKPRAEEINSIPLPKPSRTKAATVAGQNQDSPTTIKSNASPSEFCPRVVDLPLAMCIQRRRRHSMPCSSDDDCFLPGYKCCPHYCNTHACKRPKGKRPSRTRD